MPPLCKLGEQFPRELLRTEFERFAESGIYANRPVRATNRFNVGGGRVRGGAWNECPLLKIAGRQASRAPRAHSRLR